MKAAANHVATRATRLTFPVPARFSERTRTEERLVEVWKTAEPKNAQGKVNRFACELVRVEKVVEQPLFVTRPWEISDVLRVLAAGGWFNFRETEFDSPATRQFALDAQELFLEHLSEGVA